MGTKKSVVEPAVLDVGAAEQAFAQMLPQLEALDQGSLQAVRAELQLTAAIAYSVAMRDKAEPRRSKLALVAQGSVFNLSVLDELPLVALAAWHVRRKQLVALDTDSKARLPESTLKDAQATRGRMLRECTHFFEDHPDYGKRIAAIRSGSGHLDLANDLLALAELYDLPDVRAIVSTDPVYYRADDPTRARALAQQLFEGLGLTSETDAARWTDLAQRAWTLLFRDYGELRAAGQLVFRNEEDVESSYPSLVAAVRTPAIRVNPQPNPPVPPAQPAPAS